MTARSGMGFPRASLLLLATLPGCGLFLDTTPKNRADAALDAALDAPDARDMDAFAEDAFAGRDAPLGDAPSEDAPLRDDAYVADTSFDAFPDDAAAGRDGGRDASFDASFDGGTDAYDLCLSTFCGRTLRDFPSVIDLDVSEDGTRIALLTKVGASMRVELHRLMAGATWMEQVNTAADTTCHHVAVSDEDNTIGVACRANVFFVGARTGSVEAGAAIASGGRNFAVTSSSGVRVYDPPSMSALTLPVGAGACSLLPLWPGMFSQGLAMRSVPSSWAGCDVRPNLVAADFDVMSLAANRILRLDGPLDECSAGSPCCSTPAVIEPDLRHGTDISVLGEIVVSASVSGRPRFVGPVRPQVRARDGGSILSVSLGASRIDTHFVLGSIHAIPFEASAAWLQHETADPGIACDAETPTEIRLFRTADATTSLPKIRISDCDASGFLTAAVLEMPTVSLPESVGTAHVFRVHCPSRLP